MLPARVPDGSGSRIPDAPVAGDVPRFLDVLEVPRIPDAPDASVVSAPAPLPARRVRVALLTAAVLAAGLLAGAGSGCRRASLLPEPGGEALPAAVPAAELKKRLENGPRPLVLDARAAAAFDGGHVPGARPAALSDLEPFPRTRLDDAFRARVERLVRRTGARTDMETVVVEAGSAEGFQRAAALCWALALAGVERCRVLDGGIAAWTAAGGELSKDPPPPYPEDPNRPPAPRPAVRPAAFADLDALRAATASGEIGLIDVTNVTPPAIAGAVSLPVRPMIGGAGALDAAKAEPVAAQTGLRAESEVIVFGDGPLDGAAGWFVAAKVLRIPVVRLFPGGVPAWHAPDAREAHGDAGAGVGAEHGAAGHGAAEDGSAPEGGHAAAGGHAAEGASAEKHEAH